jgi:hypothetical protein
MKRKALLGMLVVIFGLGAMATQVSANVIPGNPRVGDPATTRMWCFQGTVTFTLVGPGVAIVVGTTTATPMPEGKAEVNFTVPNVPAGYYTMVGGHVGNRHRLRRQAERGQRRLRDSPRQRWWRRPAVSARARLVPHRQGLGAPARPSQGQRRLFQGPRALHSRW